MSKKYEEYDKKFSDFRFMKTEDGDTILCECGDGWLPILNQMCEEVREAGLEDFFKVTQIKEKYGVLVVYVSRSNDILDKIIRRAENRSESTCELCGNEGKLITSGWYQVRCEKCSS